MDLTKDYNVLSQSLIGYSIYGYHFNSSYQRIRYTKLLLKYYPHLKAKFEYALGYGLILYLLKIKNIFDQGFYIQDFYHNQKRKIKNNISDISTAVHINKIKVEMTLSVYSQNFKLNILNYIYMKKFRLMLLYNIYIQKIILCYYSFINLFSKY